MTAARRASIALLSVVVGGCALDLERDPDVSRDDLETVTRAMEVCADGPTVHGIDVSRFQGDIDWQRVAGADTPVDYAWIQISRDFDSLDPTFEDNWRGAGEVGILRGAYQRFSPGRDVATQAQILLDKLGTVEAGELPPMIDVEDADGLGPDAIAASVQQWLDIVEPALGVTPVIYTGFYFWRDDVGGADFTAYPLWTAHYDVDCPLTPPQWTRWTLHQYSSKARLPGITANTVDVNWFNGTLEELRALGGAPECGDGVCSGDETPATCPGDCPVCEPAPPEGRVVDDAEVCFETGGNPSGIRTETAGWDGGLKWTYTQEAEADDNYALWRLALDEGGRYRVEAHTPAPYNQSKQAKYVVVHGGATDTVTVDQSATDGWNLVGEFEFAAGAGQSVRVGDDTGEPLDTRTQIVFDAIRLTRLDGGDAEPDVDGGPGGGGIDPHTELMTTGGCAAGGSAALPGALLLAALLIARRMARFSAHGQRPRRRGQGR